MASFTALVAPSGYGKTHQIQAMMREWHHPGVYFTYPAPDAPQFFEHFRQSCLDAQLPIATTDQPEDWLRVWNTAQTPLGIALDGAEQWCHLPDVVHFWAEVLRQFPPNLQLAIASRSPLPLPLAAVCASSTGRYLDVAQLKIPLAIYQQHWREVGLIWNPTTADFYQSTAGWPVALMLYLKHCQGHLSKTAYKTLLQTALQAVFNQTDTDLVEHAWPSLWLNSEQTPPSLLAQYWLARALSEKPTTAKLYLERAEKLCPAFQTALMLRITTRLAHICSLLGQGRDSEHWLEQGEPLFEQGHPLDQAAWLYMKANRLRQCCQHEAAITYCQRVLAMKVTHAGILDFQTRAQVVWGLTAYQQGDDTTTREQYLKTLVLAQADQNQPLILQIQLMLAFLDALQGQATAASLPLDIIAHIEAQPLSTQPMMWLNLAYFWILGEQIHLAEGHAILKRVQDCAQHLGWTFLATLAADVEARLWRYGKHVEKALPCHQRALQHLEPGTFEWLNASINQALSQLKNDQQPLAMQTLNELLPQTQELGALRLSQEIQSLLQVPRLEPLIELNPATPRLKIQMFGGLRVSVAGVPIERWPRKKARQILIQLLFHPLGIHRETLMDWLFPTADLDQGYRNLDVQLHSLRKLLEPSIPQQSPIVAIGFHHSYYRFNRDCPYQWDVQDFDHHYQTWQNSKPVSEQAQAAAIQALAIYTGILLPEPDFADDWLDLRENYRLKALELAHWMTEYAAQQHQWELVEQQVQLILSWDSCHDQAWAWWLDVAGYQQDAIKLKSLYDRMNRAYLQELDAPPPPKLRALYQQWVEQAAR